MAALEDTLAYARQRCQSNAVRLTIKRQQVLEALLLCEKALSAYELVTLYENTFAQSIPVMSMYRILYFLENQALVHKLLLTNKYVACAHIACKHSHDISQFLICGKCHQVQEINMPAQAMEGLQASIKQAGFHLSSHQLEIIGVCNRCQ